MAEKNNIRELVVIGAGPGGYAAAFHAADLGVKVTLIDPEENPGGVCLYRGCIPTKALLHVAKVIADVEKSVEWGVEWGRPKIDLKKMRAWKESVVVKLTRGLGYLCKRRKVEYVRAKAVFVDNNTLEVARQRNETGKIKFEHAILATGAVPAKIPGLPYESPAVMDSKTALELENIPESMLVIGGGYIGLELGSVFARLGTKVTVVEMLPNLMTVSDPELITVLSKHLEKLFEAIMLNTKVAGLKENKEGIKATFEGEKIDEKEQVFEKVLVAVGRKPNSENIGLDKTNVQVDDKGYVRIDESCLTDAASIYAVGDVTGTPQLAHRATHQGMIAAKRVAGFDAVFMPKAIPFVEYTEPEVAECGLSEKQAKDSGLNVKVAKFPWSASGRAATLGEKNGLTKLIIDAETERILGVGIVGAGAGDLISEGALAIEMAAVAFDVAQTIHPHPTLSETIMEAAENFLTGSVNI